METASNADSVAVNVNQEPARVVLSPLTGKPIFNLSAMDRWVHPTGNQPQSVCVWALGPSKHNGLEDTTKHEPPKEIMDCDEYWGINGGVNWFGGICAYDVLWVMDHLDGEAAKEPQYAEYIKRWMTRHDSPVMTSHAGTWGLHKQIHEYPVHAVEDFYCLRQPYFHNSIPYIIAYAGAIGVQRLVIYGADYSHESLKGREEDRPCAEYWCRAYEQLGGLLQLPSSSTLKSTNKGVWYYGYPRTPKRAQS
jgi:hypothetical protein